MLEYMSQFCWSCGQLSNMPIYKTNTHEWWKCPNCKATTVPHNNIEPSYSWITNKRCTAIRTSCRYAEEIPETEISDELLNAIRGVVL